MAKPSGPLGNFHVERHEVTRRRINQWGERIRSEAHVLEKSMILTGGQCSLGI